MVDGCLNQNLSSYLDNLNESINGENQYFDFKLFPLHSLHVVLNFSKRLR